MAQSRFLVVLLKIDGLDPALWHEASLAADSEQSSTSDWAEELTLTVRCEGMDYVMAQ